MYAKVGESEFRTQERRYKGCKSVQEAIAFGALSFDHIEDVDIDTSLLNVSTVRVFGKECQMYELVGHEGAFVVTNVLNRKQQVELAYSSLNESLRPPNRTNLHCHYNEDEIQSKLQSIWSSDGPCLDSLVIHSNGSNANASSPDGTDGDSNRNKSKNKSNNKNKSKNDKGNRIPSNLTLSKVRWATLGYQYNWTERSYSRQQFVPFPQVSISTNNK